MRIIGLTGPIGAGKSTVARWLAALGAWTIDADQLVHRLYATDEALQSSLAQRFGARIISGGTVDRRALADAVFGPTGEPGQRSAALGDLEAIVHPAVRRLQLQEFAAARAAGAEACVYEASKMVESGGSAQVDELWIVTAGEAVQLSRLAARGVDEAEARRRMAQQGTITTWTTTFAAESRRAGRPRLIIIFDNSGTEAEGQAQAARLWYGVVAGR